MTEPLDAMTTTAGYVLLLMGLTIGTAAIVGLYALAVRVCAALGMFVIEDREDE